ncbi:hypothetical protein DSO57_1018223 [Entomophthora muscae]|uniref:Uncharacterized protein n=1 Tax=Entomophthora muscae TaxID=34485 RepID=A0ACC2RVU5_9FUNG|nr:hypothetical protein DSO57_1018223 [Entomophthora muscae]
MEQKEEFEPLNLKLQSSLKEATRKRDWLAEHIRTNLRLIKVDEIKNRYLKAQLDSLKGTCEYPEPEDLESLPERAVESLNSELKSIPERVFEELRESVRLFTEISKTQSITHSKMIQTTNCVKARECHFKVANERTAYDPLTEDEKDLLIQPDLPGESVKRKSSFPMADLIHYPPLSLNKRYQNRLLNRRRAQGDQSSP